MATVAQLMRLTIIKGRITADFSRVRRLVCPGHGKIGQVFSSLGGELTIRYAVVDAP